MNLFILLKHVMEGGKSVITSGGGGGGGTGKVTFLFSIVRR